MDAGSHHHRLYEQPWPEGEYRMFQLGVMVDDVVAAARRWALVHGVGPFTLLRPTDQHTIFRGEPAIATIQVAVAQAGPVQIELIQQHCDRPSIYREWLGGRPAGVHQLCTVTPHFDRAKDHYRELGYEIAAESTSSTVRVAYVDTSVDFGFYTEIVEQSPGFLSQLAAIAEGCRTWDGTDPVRIPTRDGYRVP